MDDYNSLPVLIVTPASFLGAATTNEHKLAGLKTK